MNLLKNFPNLQGLVKASTATNKREWRDAMDVLVRPPMIDSAPKTMKLWSLKEAEEFYKNNPMFVRHLEVRHE